MTINVTNAVSVADLGSTIEALSSRSKTTDARVMDRIIITVPPTIGVTTRRRMKSHLDMTSCVTAAIRTSVASVAGPPSATAAMQNGIENAAVNIGSTAPPPTGPIRRTCTSVDTPTTSSDANTIHVRYASSIPAASDTTTGVTSRVADAIRLNCAPSPSDESSGGLSCASYLGLPEETAVARCVSPR